jgi:DNA-binding transcriptional ArsR family regulator
MQVVNSTGRAALSGEAPKLSESTTAHPERRRLIEALWHSSEPLSAQQFHDEYSEGELTPATVAYHLRQLEDEGVVEGSGGYSNRGDVNRSYVLGGPNASEAVRRLGLGGGAGA